MASFQRANTSYQPMRDVSRPDPAALRTALADYDLRTLASARVGEMAPDFTLADATGKTYRLSQFRGKQTVVLRFILFDF